MDILPLVISHLTPTNYNLTCKNIKKKSAIASVYKLLQQMSKNVKHTACSLYVVTESQTVAQDFQQWTYMRKL
jgi:hypothetical protein